MSRTLTQPTTLILTIVALAWPAHAAEGDPPADPPWAASARLVDGDAAAFATVRLVDVADAFAFSDLVSGLSPALAKSLEQARAALALTSWSRTELASRGIDPEAPLILAWGAGASGGAVRHRVVVPATEPTDAVAAVVAAFERIGFTFGGGKPTKATAWWPSAKTLASKLGARVAADAAGRVVLVRVVARHVVVDVAEPAVEPAPRAVARAIARGMASLSGALTAARPRQPTATLADTWTSGARRLLTEDGSAAIVIVPTGLARLLPPACRPTTTGWFTDAGATFVLRAFEWRARLAFTPTSQARAALGEAGVDDGLLDPRALATVGLASGVLNLASARALAAHPRPPLRALSDAIDACGPAGVVMLAARDWPALVATTLDDLGTALAIGPGDLGNARNLGFVLRASDGEPPSLTRAASFANDAADELGAAVSGRASAPGERASVGDRTPTIFALTQAPQLRVAGIEPLPGARVALTATDAPDLTWYYEQRRRPAVFGSRGRLGSLHVNVAALLERIATLASPDALAAVRLAGQQIGMLGGELRMQGDLLRLDLELGSAM